jgi:hypothetical protein
MQKTIFIDHVVLRVWKKQIWVPQMQKQEGDTTDKRLSDKNLQEKLTVNRRNGLESCK